MYTYPDKNDMLTMELINQEFDGIYWGKSEEEVLSYAIQSINGIEGHKKMLDLGCGMGRLFETFSPYVDFIQAVEPDEQRYAEAVKAASVFDEKVNVKHGDLSALEQDDERFQIILMSHILQHMKEESVIRILEDLESKTEANAIHVVTTTHTEGDENLYYREFWSDGVRKNEKTDKAGLKAARRAPQFSKR